jgi:hypothetical protein
MESCLTQNKYDENKCKAYRKELEDCLERVQKAQSSKPS